MVGQKDSKMVLMMVAKKVDKMVVYLKVEELAVSMVEQMVQQWVAKKGGVEVGPMDAWMIE